jgi:hypothetical protein
MYIRKEKGKDALPNRERIETSSLEALHKLH